MKFIHKKADILVIDFGEINAVPAVLEKRQTGVQGLFPIITSQDFPIRGHQVYFLLNATDG